MFRYVAKIFFPSWFYIVIAAIGGLLGGFIGGILSAIGLITRGNPAEEEPGNGDDDSLGSLLESGGLAAKSIYLLFRGPLLGGFNGFFGNAVGGDGVIFGAPLGTESEYGLDFAVRSTVQAGVDAHARVAQWGFSSLPLIIVGGTYGAIRSASVGAAQGIRVGNELGKQVGFGQGLFGFICGVGVSLTGVGFALWNITWGTTAGIEFGLTRPVYN